MEDRAIRQCIREDNAEGLEKRYLMKVLAVEEYTISALFNSGPKILELCLKSGVDPNKLDDSQETALWHICDSLCCESRTLYEIELLIKYHADVNYSRPVLGSVLDRAVETSSSTKLVKLLLNNGAKPSIRSFISDYCPKSESNDIFKLLIEARADPDLRVWNVTLLETITKRLINMGGDTGYQRYIESEREKVIILLDHGADPRHITHIPGIENYRRPSFSGIMLRKYEKKEIFTILCINKYDTTGKWYLGILPPELLRIIFEILITNVL